MGALTRLRWTLTTGMLLGQLLIQVSTAQAVNYPTNVCVSRKLAEAGRYCSRALHAWARWDASHDDATRDTALESATTRFDRRWRESEEKSLQHGVDCAETTDSRYEIQGLIDSAVGATVEQVNGGLDLATQGNARCGEGLLDATARKCRGLLKAEGGYLGKLLGEPDPARRERSKQKASQQFSTSWSNVIEHGCPTDATEQDVEARIDTLTADIVANSIVSPNVDDAQYTTISPTGTTEYLGREFSPTCMNGSPYHFFVKRGSVNKLLMYYQGGGACWEQLTCSVPACDTNVNPTGGDNPNNRSTGFADRAKPANPFKDWNVVFVSYCSCDIHFGDAAQDYPLHVEHRGYHNARVAEKWAREHFLNPEVIFVTGSSAGAYGAWLHAPLLHAVWPGSQFHVLADAGNGVITQDFLDNFFPNWNFASNVPHSIPGLGNVLQEGSGIPGYTEVIANFFPRTHWAHYATAFDGGAGGQTGFYNLMLNDNDPLQALFWWNGSCAFNAVMRTQAIQTAAAVPSNYRYYIGTGSRHTMWGSNKVYADTTGGVPTIVDWINAMMTGSPAWTNVECTNCGLTLPGDPVPNPLQPPFEMIGSDIVIDCGS